MNKRQKIDKNILLRLMKYLTNNFKKELIIIVVSIIISSVCHVYGQLFLQTLIDDYITPLLSSANPVYTPLLKAVGFMAIIYLVGVICTFLYTRIIAIVSQGVLKIIRDDMFLHMETLPIMVIS